ncbi:hypothetical protein FJZ53_02955 [Candidatus Woesearchaeota archaeon]|nr:hypothetical protein [Candidatus Woesearchaeota archaeon]
MYAEFETRTSYEYLQEVIKSLEDPICILGGWAVFFHVNKNFQKSQGRPYLGSRDIDLGFHLDKNMALEEMKSSALAKDVDVLQNRLKFKPISFRFFKEIHTETGKEIETGHVPSHFIFPMYVDPIVDFIPKRFKEVFHFQPIDEPLLQFAFKDKAFREELEDFNKRLWVPKPELLAATKINALKGRDKGHKKIKDICDIFALLWYSGEKPQLISKKIRQFTPKGTIKKAYGTIKEKDYEKAGSQVNHDTKEVKKVIETLTA